MKSEFEELRDEVNAGLEGRNSGIPMGFNRLNSYIGIRKSMYTLIGGYTGSAKSTYVDCAYVLNPIDWYFKNAHKTNIKLKIIYWSMERKRKYKIAKWVSRKIFLEEGLVIPIDKMLGWNGKMNKGEIDLFNKYEDYIDTMFREGILTMIDAPTNPTGIHKYLKEYAEGSEDGSIKGIGEIHKSDKYTKTFHEYDPNLVTIVIIDHAGLSPREKGMEKKENIDKLSEYLRISRDLYSLSPVLVQQFNRSISNPIRLKMNDVTPSLEDFSETATTQHDADVVLSLFDPMRYKVEDPSGYNLEKLKLPDGKKLYRSLTILKSNFSSDDVRIGLALQPETGVFKEMIKKSEITDYDYECIRNNSYFLT